MQRYGIHVSRVINHKQTNKPKDYNYESTDGADTSVQETIIA